MMGRYSFCSSSSASFYFFCIMIFTPLVLCQLPANQRNTMMKLSQLVGVESWNTTASNPCLWKGVTCNSTNNNSTSISRLSLSGLGISDSDFLTILCQIDSLQFLDLSLNYLTSIPDGFIANCGKITELTVLSFHGNRLGGRLPMFNGFSGLEVLDLSNNYLSGNIGSELDGLAGIRSLNLSMNNFTGFIPTKLGKSLVLEELQLSKNDFQGPIPEELFLNYQNLTLIDLSVNNLTGSVPITIKSLSKLEILLLSSNSLTGAIPKGLSSIQTLSRLAANQNRFTGTIPNGISRYVTSLDLSYNLLNGSLPDDLLSPPNVQYVDLSYNSLVGPIPRNISPNLDRLRLGSNFLNGRLPPAAFGSFLSLTYLELDNNSFSGNIPTELGSCKNLALLNLAQNKLTGSLPKELGSLKQLEVLKLQLNRLNGEIPPEFSQLSLLSTLNISGNSLSGSIPLELSSLQRLTYINLQDNKLTGSIPDLSGNSNLQELQLGTNCLTGQVVNLPSSLKFALNLSHNCFKGPIPDVLRRLDAIEILDLSNNNFTGKIPEFLTRIDTLILLVLSNNQLSGPIPDFKPYVRVERSGNNDLFITKTTPKSNPTYTSTNKKISASLVIFVSIVTAVIAVGIVAVVLFLVSRRFYRVNGENLRSEEEVSLPQVIVGHIITTNRINKSEINFDSAMKAITNPKNIKLKSRFSTYYKAAMPCGTSYYVKKLNWSDKIFQSGNHERFGQELEALGRLSNSSVMIPLAYVLSVDSAYVFYEYARGGTLFDALHQSLGHSLDWATRFNMAMGVAEGLAFLHGCNTGPILLLDLSTKSILLKSLKEPLIGDIELCKVIDPSKSTGSLSAVAGSVGYIPPEYAYTMRVTMPGNVYSFGVILLELVTGKPAVSNGTELAKWVLSNSTKREDWDRILDPTLSKTSLFVQNQMLSVLKIALGCIATVPVTRPTMKSVLRMLLNAR